MKSPIFVHFLAVLLWAGCDANPDERTRISGPRLLAVQSSPPALHGIEGAVDLKALAIDGDGLQLSTELVRYRVCSPWEFLVDPDRDCPESSALLVTGSQVTAREILDFYPLPPSVGDNLDPDESDSNSTCDPRASIEVPIVAELRTGESSHLTVKRLPVYSSEPERKNPRIDDIEIVAQDEGDYLVSIHLDPSSLDIECRDEFEVLEAIRVYLYSTSGSFESSSVDVVPTDEGRIEPAEVRWTSSSENATLVFVAVDNDGGVAWKTVSL